MAEYTYPVIVKPMLNRDRVLGIEYWFPDFEECEHIFFEGISDDSAAADMTRHLFMLLAGRNNSGDRCPTPKWYGAGDFPPLAQLRYHCQCKRSFWIFFRTVNERRRTYGIF